MLVKKVVNTKIILTDAEDIYSSDLEAVILKKLVDRYVGRCFVSMLVKSIDSILRLSDIVYNDKLNIEATVDVKFIASGLYLEEGEILFDCTIDEAKNTHIIASSVDVVCTIRTSVGNSRSSQQNNISNIVKVGQQIPIIVKSSTYDIGRSKISAIGQIFHIVKEPSVCYRLTSDSASPVTNTKAIEDQQSTLQGLIDELDGYSSSKIYKYFVEMMYPYRSKQDMKEAKYIPIDQLVKSCLDQDMPHKYVILDDRVDKVSMQVAVCNRVDETKQLTVEADPIDMASIVLNKYILYHKNLLGFIMSYSDVERLKSQTAYFQVIKQTKL